MMQSGAMQRFFQSLETNFDFLNIHENPMQFPLVNIWRAVAFKDDHHIILDFLLAESRFHRNVLDRAIEIDFSGMPLKVITLEDLILFKKSAGRPQDIADLTNIHEIFGHEIDGDYVEFWSDELRREGKMED